MAHGARGRQGPGVVAVGEDLPAAAERAVHRTGNANGEAADSARERPPVFGLGDEMDVVVLDGELENPELRVRGGGEGAAHGREEPSGPEGTDGIDRPERHVHGMGRDVVRARPVGYAGPASGHGFAPGAGPAPAPGAGGGQGKLNGSTRHRLDWANLSF